MKVAVYSLVFPRRREAGTQTIAIDAGESYREEVEVDMERDSAPVAFPLLCHGYSPCTIPYRSPSDPRHRPTPTELAWITLFRKSVPSLRKQAEADDTVVDAESRATRFAERYTKILDELQEDTESHGGPPDCILLCRLREVCLRECGFWDIFKKVKEEENVKAISILSDVIAKADSISDQEERLEHLLKGVFAGNIFDLGVTQLAELFASDGISFIKSYEKLLPRPWVVDDLDQFKSRWLQKSWKKAVIFVDNAGSDVVLGILPFARELLQRGTKVVLAANDMPALNDITYLELSEIISKIKEVKDGKESLFGVDAQHLYVVSSGNDLPVIDLSSVSPDLEYIAADADLVILEGMGRGIETNLYATFKCDSLNLGMVKHPEVAEFLGGRLFDCVIKYKEYNP